MLHPVGVRVILCEWVRVPPSINQFSQALDYQIVIQLLKLTSGETREAVAVALGRKLTCWQRGHPHQETTYPTSRDQHCHYFNGE